MALRATSSILAVLFSMAWVGSLYSQTPAPPRTPPVLRSGGTYSSNQEKSQSDQNSIPVEVDEGSVVRVSTSLITVPAVVMVKFCNVTPDRLPGLEAFPPSLRWSRLLSWRPGQHHLRRPCCRRRQRFGRLGAEPAGPVQSNPRSPARCGKCEGPPA